MRGPRLQFLCAYSLTSDYADLDIHTLWGDIRTASSADEAFLFIRGIFTPGMPGCKPDSAELAWLQDLGWLGVVAASWSAEELGEIFFSRKVAVLLHLRSL
jgi:hypothetical protein